MLKEVQLYLKMFYLMIKMIKKKKLKILKILLDTNFW